MIKPEMMVTKVFSSPLELLRRALLHMCVGGGEAAAVPSSDIIYRYQVPGTVSQMLS